MNCSRCDGTGHTWRQCPNPPPAKKGWDGRVPFDALQGHLLHYPRSWDKVEWADNHEFLATLVYDGFARGRSAAYVWWKEMGSGKRFPMFLSDLDEVLKTKVVEHRKVAGKWTFAKKGENY